MKCIKKLYFTFLFVASLIGSSTQAMNHMHPTTPLEEEEQLKMAIAESRADQMALEAYEKDLRKAKNLSLADQQTQVPASKPVETAPAASEHSTTYTTTILPILSALCKGADFMGYPVSSWQPANEKQAALLRYLEGNIRTQLSQFSEQELAAWASNNSEELNNILKSKGFDIQLQPFSSPDFGVVSILNVAVEWYEKGEETTVRSSTDGKQYPAVKMKSNIKILKSLNNQHKHPILAIRTKSSDVVYMTKVDKPYQDLELLKYIESIEKTDEISSHSLAYYAGAIFPMVSLNQKVDVSWMLNMTAPNAVISQALQQTIFSMDETGAHAKSAFAMGVTRGCQPDPLLIDGPFILWIRRPGVTAPIFAGYITEDTWEKPNRK